jgi:hypothetical protein
MNQPATTQMGSRTRNSVCNSEAAVLAWVILLGSDKEEMARFQLSATRVREDGDPPEPLLGVIRLEGNYLVSNFLDLAQAHAAQAEFPPETRPFLFLFFLPGE